MTCVVASDRSIGGFGHTWGEDSPKVQRKRRLLESEGVVFDEKGKIHKHCFVGVSSETTTTSTTTKSDGNESNKRKVVDATVNTTATDTTTKKKKCKSSKYFNNAPETETEEALKKEILDLLQKRQVGKTC